MANFYTFRQNNSHGRWVGPQFIVVEADSAEQANKVMNVRAQVNFGSGCPCCGPRWTRAADNSDYTTCAPSRCDGSKKVYFADGSES